MDSQTNYPHPNTPTTKAANPGTQNQTASSEVGYPGHRGNAPEKGGMNYGGGEGTGIEKARNHPSSIP
jgi:hypothetical protein